MNALTGWRKLREPLPFDFDPESSCAALQAAEQVLREELVKVKETKQVKNSLRDLHVNNHFAELIASTVEDNTRQ